MALVLRYHRGLMMDTSSNKQYKRCLRQLMHGIHHDNLMQPVMRPCGLGHHLWEEICTQDVTSEWENIYITFGHIYL